MRDGITIEQRGIPAAVICTEPFIATAKAMAKICGLPDYPFATVRHPIGSLAAIEVERRAEAVLPQVVAILRHGVITSSPAPA